MVIEQIFACGDCGTERQFGCAVSFLDGPDNHRPILRCSHCHRTTVHIYVENRPRSLERDKEMRTQFRDAYRHYYVTRPSEVQ